MLFLLRASACFSLLNVFWGVVSCTEVRLLGFQYPLSSSMNGTAYRWYMAGGKYPSLSFEPVSMGAMHLFTLAETSLALNTEFINLLCLQFRSRSVHKTLAGGHTRRLCKHFSFVPITPKVWALVLPGFSPSQTPPQLHLFPRSKMN